MNTHSGQRGFSLVEMMIASCISVVLMVATWMVVSNMLKTDDDNRVRLELQLEAAQALRKISDLLKMTGPTGISTVAWAPGNYPVFALDTTPGSFPAGYTFVNLATYQTPPGGGVTTLWNDAVVHLAPSNDTDGYYGQSNEIAFQLPRPTPWYYPAAAPAGTVENPIDETGCPVDPNGVVTWGISPTLYSYYSTSPSVPGASPALADRQTDVYAIVLVPTASFEMSGGATVAGPNQLELREFSALPNRYIIRRTVLAYNVERIVFASYVSSNYYLTGGAGGSDFRDSSLGLNQLRVTLWMWKNNINNKNKQLINAYKAMQSITVNLRSVGQSQN
ncbi:MAG TPA: prepilin-type N-terminal cleavage/methylation domain-containing protein [Planctomycetota bacterium]|nr:prepilin-type N-terminal cleavage/methylation domain-containing protein [Planctomycetota bacterium]